MDTLSLQGLRVLISGAGIGGPAAAWWLSRYGAQVTVVERAAAPRSSGFRVDFRGPTQLGVLAEMGLLDALRRHATGTGAMRFIDERGGTVFELPAAFAGGDLEIHRADLSHLLMEASGPRADYRFGDQVTALCDTGDGLDVDFEHAPAARYDLVVGADGLHSGVRRLGFGHEERFVTHLGYAIAGWQADTGRAEPVTPALYNEPGRLLSVGADQRQPARAEIQTIFTCPPLDLDWHDQAAQRRLVGDTVRQLGWRGRECAATLEGAPDLYFDAICRVRVPAFSRGRLVLLGDAGWGVTLGGMGVGTAVVAARVLAGELARSGGDLQPAFAAYESVLRTRLLRWQRSANPGRFLAPASRLGLGARNAMLRSSVIRRLLVGSTRSLADDPGLPVYAPPQNAVSANSTTR